MRASFTFFFLLIFSCCIQNKAFAQQKAWFKLDTLTSLTSGGKKMVNPWAGGLNAPQFLKMHLNSDEEEDLVVFDRTNSKVTTFLAAADPVDPAKKTFIHAPYYETLFPKADNWMILADYNGDGHKDLFTSTSLGITVYRQAREGNSWQWKKETDVIYTKGFSGNINLQVSGTDIPGIVDIDDDGDLDLLTFDFSGTFIELHQNLSMEKFGVPDSLGSQQNPVFRRNGDCWGNFHKGTGEGFEFGADCGVTDLSGNRVMHAGNSILLKDLNGDGKKDLVVGHVSNDHISFINNSVTGLAANFTSYTNSYPAKDPVELHIFPAAFYEDMDFDGIPDLLVAPNVPSNDMNLTDFRSSGWLYHNAGTESKPDFQLVKKNLLQDQMLDVGENAAPSFFDVDGDGDLDMLIGTGGVPGTNGFRGRFWLLKNEGTATEPAFVVESENYLNIPATLGLFNIKPQWADFNGDGKIDLGFSGISLSNLRLEYRYIPNKAAAGAPAQLNLAEAVTITLPADLLSSDSPHFYDADNDGDLDLVVGKGQGNLFYYTNTDGKFTFKLESDAFAGVGINFAGRSPQVAVADFDLDGRPDLATVDHTGNLRIFHSANWGAWTERTLPLAPVNGNQVNFGNYLALGVGDLNGDGKPDLAIGSNAGGIRLLSNILPVTITGVEPGNAPVVKVFPNPVTTYLTVSSSKAGSFRVLNVAGRQVVSDVPLRANIAREISTESWSAGLYLVEIKTGESRIVKKVLVE